MKTRKKDDKVRLTALIPPGLMQKLNDAFDASTHKSRQSFVTEILEQYLSQEVQQDA